MQLIKALKIKTSLVFSLAFANRTILSCFFLFVLIMDLSFLISAFNAQSFNPTAELAIQEHQLMKQMQKMENNHWQHKQRHGKVI